MSFLRCFLLCLCTCLVLNKANNTRFLLSRIYRLVDDAVDVNRSLLENAAAILQPFCSDLITCGGPSGDIAGDLGTGVGGTGSNGTPWPGIPDDTMRELYKLANELSGCCYQCSCRLDCRDRDNCCLDKLIDAERSGDTQVTEPSIDGFVQYDCVSANILSYMPDNVDVFPYIEQPIYYMVTTCAPNTQYVSMDNKCRNPRTENIDEVLPVTSRTTGRIYYNKFCALCNNDTDIVPWKIRFYSTRSVRFCDTENTTSCIPISNDVSEQYAHLLRFAPYHIMIDFNPPGLNKDLMDDICFPDSSRYFYLDNHTRSQSTKFLLDACDTINIPYKMRNGRLLYQNIFCALSYLAYVENYMLGSMNQMQICTADGSIRFPGEGYIGLLRYGVDIHDTVTGQPRADDGPCGCFGIMDMHQTTCIPLSCPFGEAKVGCDCWETLSYIYGFPFAVHLKLQPLSPAMAELNTAPAYLEPMKAAVLNAVERMSPGVIVVNFLILQTTNRSHPYYHMIALLKTKPGLDSKLLLCKLVSESLAEAYNIVVGTTFLSMTKTFTVNVNNAYINKHIYANGQNLSLIEEISFWSLRTFMPILIPLRNFATLSCCKSVSVVADEVMLPDGGTAPRLGDRVLPEEYWHQHDGGRVTICRDDYTGLRSSGGAIIENILSELLLRLVIIVCMCCHS